MQREKSELFFSARVGDVRELVTLCTRLAPVQFDVYGWVGGSILFPRIFISIKKDGIVSCPGLPRLVQGLEDLAVVYVYRMILALPVAPVTMLLERQIVAGQEVVVPILTPHEHFEIIVSMEKF